MSTNTFRRPAALALIALCGLTAAPAAAVAAPVPFYQIRNIVLNPNGAAVIPLPVQPGFPNAPVLVLVTETLANHAQLQPSSTIAAVVNFDPVAGTISWVGTNNDGTLTKGNTLALAGAPPPIVATFFCGNACTIARLVANGRANALVLRQSPRPAIPGHYVVTLRQ